MMKVWCRGVVLCALLLTASMTRPSHGATDQPASGKPAASADVWSQRAQHFDELWNGDQRTQAEQEMLADGRDAAAAGLQGVVKALPASDPHRIQAGFALYVLDLDRALGRSVLVAASRPGSRPDPFDYAFPRTIEAYEYRPDRELLSSILELAPYADGASAEPMHGFLQRLAYDHPGDLLSALGGKSPRVHRSVAAALLCRLEQEGAVVDYTGLKEIAADRNDQLRPEAQRLLAEMREIGKQQQAAEAQLQRQEERRFPLVPKGVTLPASAVEALRTSYPRWHIMGTSGFAPEVVAFVRKHFGKAATPQHCSGDFDGNGLRDEALLIRENGGEGVKLVALRQVKAGRWSASALASTQLSGGIQGGYSGFSIYVTPRTPGTIAYWTDQGKTGRLRLKRDGVEWNLWGKTSLLYYWNGSAWASVQTGD